MVYAWYTRRFGDFHNRPRIILISDGKPTDFTAINVIDVDDSPDFETEKDKNHLLQYTNNVGKLHPIFCIPVGRNPDLVIYITEFLSAQSRGGKIIYPHKARQFAKYTANTQNAPMLSYTMRNDGNDRDMILTLLACKFPDKEFLERDQDALKEELIDEMDDVHQERDPRMPSLGSRVKRGRDWKWNYQDSNGPGTVIGHLKDGPFLLRSYIGPDWNWEDQDCGTGSIGSVYRVKRNGAVYERDQ
ncbi:uncharacterized protein LOC134231394 [Saccostrea cucullata]|uniref:uncharacterized protein LOC134231394 n=1 Tax=Saccostrea cuccullata TaxID=36930 RepID=UPI002ECFEC05